MTLNAAEILGLGDLMGSIDVGKRADLIVTDGDPLQIVTHVEQAFIARSRSVAGKQTHSVVETVPRQALVFAVPRIR